MRFLLFSLVFLFPFLSQADCSKAKDPTACEVKRIQTYYKSEFFKVSSRVQRNEPFLYITEFTKQYPELQAWVRKHQRFIQKNQIHLRLLLHKRGKNFRIEKDVAPLFLEFYTTYNNFLAGFIENADVHLAMITDEPYREEFRLKLITVLSEIIYSVGLGIDKELPYFNSETCDYFAQPFNAVWFSIRGMYLIDQYMSLLKPDDWRDFKDEKGIILDEDLMIDALGTLVRSVDSLEF